MTYISKRKRSRYFTWGRPGGGVGCLCLCLCSCAELPMGRATRWLRGLFGGKKPATDGAFRDKEKRRWGCGMPLREKEQQRWRGEQEAAADDRKGSYREAFAASAARENDVENQSRRAIAVAEATAAVAEAAVAAAQAAAAVVRLTSTGRAPVASSSAAVRKREETAAIKIQAAFRGYLARRALQALRGLVKLQALVRGYIVRKQAAETLRCMQALVRVQAKARACRVLRSERCRFEKTPSCHVASSLCLQRTSSRLAASDSSIGDRVNSGGLNWLERWMEERCWDGRGSGSRPREDEKNAKILEVDPGKPQLYRRKRNARHNHSSCSTLTSDPNSHSFLTVPESSSMESTAAQHLRFPFELGGHGESPHFYPAAARPRSSSRGAFTPPKSECSGSLFSGYSGCPNYMANTESSTAKVRSHSAPKQRPDRRNPAGLLAQRSSSLHAKLSNQAYPGSGRLDRLGMPIVT